MKAIKKARKITTEYQNFKSIFEENSDATGTMISAGVDHETSFEANGLEGRQKRSSSISNRHRISKIGVSNIRSKDGIDKLVQY